jgi:signal transduction histidine kinase
VLGDMATSVGEVIKEIRVLSYLIKPAGLERNGLARTVRDFVHGFGARTGLTASFLTRGPVDAVPPQVRHAAYRIVQEALSNVYRHADALHADVELVSEERRPDRAGQRRRPGRRGPAGRRTGQPGVRRRHNGHAHPGGPV